MLSNRVCPVCTKECPYLARMCNVCNHWIKRSLKALSDAVNCWEGEPSFKEAFIRNCRATVENTLKEHGGTDKVKVLANDFMLLAGSLEVFRTDPEGRERLVQCWLEKETKEKGERR
jgi:predicted amidophosphoribosyltransferase